MKYVHIYYGNGKGKTTSAIGQIIRNKGYKKTVKIIQFFKDKNTGEFNFLKNQNIFYAFWKPRDWINKKNVTLNDKKDFNNFFDIFIKEKCFKNFYYPDLLVLDEIGHVLNCGLLHEKILINFINKCKEKTEIILTGHNFNDNILKIGDYITYFKKEKHPYDKGVQARKGIEY